MSSERKHAATPARASLEPLTKNGMLDLIMRLRKSYKQSRSQPPIAIINFARPVADGQTPPQPDSADIEFVTNNIRESLAAKGFIVEKVKLENLTVRQHGRGKCVAVRATVTCDYKEPGK